MVRFGVRLQFGLEKFHRTSAEHFCLCISAYFLNLFHDRLSFDIGVLV